jgi:regulation of enolase protein 1 (concanavalin A-like superfamily)
MTFDLLHNSKKKSNIMDEARSFVPTIGFNSIGATTGGLLWFCPPGSWSTKDDGLEESQRGWWKLSKEDSELCLAPPAKRDFWRKTYYEPLLVKDDAPFLYRSVCLKDLPITIETGFSISSKSQFDQAGILVRLDHEHWLKTGIEVVDGIPRLSCVVTNSFSDWSTQSFPKAEIAIRVHVLPQQGGSLVVEAAPLGSDEWTFIRIAHLNRGMKHDLFDNDPQVKQSFRGEIARDDSIMVGIFGACPVDQAGMVVTFHNFSIVQGSSFVHDA